MGRNGQESIGKGVNCVAISRSHGCQQKSRKAKPNYDFSTSNHLEFDLVSDYYGKLGEDFILDELRCCVCWLSILIQIDSWELVQSIRKKRCSVDSRFSEESWFSEATICGGDCR